jgi:hypothetical protein
MSAVVGAALKLSFRGAHSIPPNRGSALFFVGDVSFSIPIAHLER